MEVGQGPPNTRQWQSSRPHLRLIVAQSMEAMPARSNLVER
jgi:hypothetical protein